jgi:maltooligosyltrehalose trehalohydrolase
MGDGAPVRRLPVGAELRPEGAVHFRAWAPGRHTVELLIESGSGEGSRHVGMAPEDGGYFQVEVPGTGAGTLYRYLLDGDGPFPDPASRFQPQGPHGPSEVIDPSSFHWSDDGWTCLPLEGQAIYEMHVGSFTQAGRWAAAVDHLPELVDLGITLLELMPVSEFPGRFGWGYDGVDLFAPTHLYGRPDEFRAFVDRAHSLKMGVILDVVYNHLGPDGNYLKQFSSTYFTDRHSNEWGEAVNFDGEGSGPVREFYISNAGYWIDEYHLDGLRIDATQTIWDESPDHVLAAISRRARGAGHGRRILLVAENEPQQVRLVRAEEEGGYGMDALWNDDFHHSAAVALTGRNEAYLIDYHGSPQELISAIKWGYLYQGQRYRWQGKRRGMPTFGLKPSTFVLFIQNHDQIANSARGLRVHQLTSPGRHRAMTALLLLAPGTPMLFQGQEFSASSPFLYFADHNPEVAALVRSGRAEFVAQFASVADPEMRRRLDDPSDPATFQRSILDHSERLSHAPALSLHRDLLRLRREDPLFRQQEIGRVDGAVLGSEALGLRFFGEKGDDRLLLLNLGRDLQLDPVPEPLLAPPEGREWELLWSSEHPDYGGTGTPLLETDSGWHIPGHAAVVLRPSAITERE